MAKGRGTGNKLPCVGWLLLVCGSVGVLCQGNELASRDIVIGEYCQDESLEASCPQGKVLLMQTARFGRMKMGECVKRDLGYMGCAVDVLRHLDTRCSGRMTCEVSVMDPALRTLKPCPSDVTWHLEAAYRCIPVHTSLVSTCHANQRVILTSSHGFLSSTVASQSGVGTAKCPWHLKAKPGQKINITAFNFVNSVLSSEDDGRSPADNPVCYQFATVTEGQGNRVLTVCSGEPRSKVIYVSTTNQVTIEFVDRRSAPQQSMQFLLEYKVQGCADLVTKSRSMWTKRTGDDLHVKCNRTGESWYLTCAGDNWRGRLGNCSDGGALSNTAKRGDEWKIESMFGTGSDFPVGILIIVSVGVALGVFLGGTLLIVVALHMKRKRRAKAARAACLDPSYLSAENQEKSTRTVPFFDHTDSDPYNMPKDCFSTGHRSTDTLEKAVEFTSDGRCTTSACMPPPPYGRNQSRLYESPKVSL